MRAFFFARELTAGKCRESEADRHDWRQDDASHNGSRGLGTGDLLNFDLQDIVDLDLDRVITALVNTADQSIAFNLCEGHIDDATTFHLDNQVIPRLKFGNKIDLCVIHSTHGRATGQRQYRYQDDYQFAVHGLSLRVHGVLLC